ncbi:Putative CRAL-TRIO lipid binding domain-containing protein [Septoria linicola]|uniref:CRAL-TRIO lipid binding domain-containing protein n=1 Tax=Septoria linicola TaxID=215465 RepID=A0A9Q9ATB3_9PEZI|nr:Putative CRAL-TRIO lipid binding domain-containing protein [Septoria linicola]
MAELTEDIPEGLKWTNLKGQHLVDYATFRKDAAADVEGLQSSDTADSLFGKNNDQHNLAQALAQLQKARQIRVVNAVNKTYNSFGVDAYEETCGLYPQWTGRLCKKGQPVCIFSSAILDAQTMKLYRESSTRLEADRKTGPAAGKVSMEVLRSILVFDNLTMFVMPLCSLTACRAARATPVSKMVLLVDISGLGWSQMWNLKGYVQDFINILSTCFPEVLDKVFITGASGAFPTIWNLIKRWADAETIRKFVILSPNEVLPSLQEYIEMENIPTAFGGLHELGIGTRPDLDRTIKTALEWEPEKDQELPEGPLKWDAGTIAVAVGSVQGVQRENSFASVAI